MDARLIGRLKSLFDLYSPSLASRTVVLATMALGVFLLARSAASGSAIGALPFVLLVWANHERFLTTLDGLFERHGWFVIAVPLSVFVARMIMQPPAATDDLLRHIASAFWPGGYRDMYVHTSLPPAELYPLFDAFVGWLARLFGAAQAMWIMQAIAFSAFVLVFIVAARRLLGGNPATAILTLVALALVLSIMVGRLSLARPEILLTVWAIGAILVQSSLGLVMWIAVGAVLGFGYWLAPIYFPAVLLLKLSWRGRALALLVLGLLWAAFWLSITGGDSVAAMAWTLERVADRIPGIAVSENASVLNVLFAPAMLALGLGALWALRQPATDRRLLWLAAYFLLANQARYGGIIAPLLALAILSGLKGVVWPLAVPIRSAVVLFGAAWFSLMSNGIPRYAELPKFVLPEGAVVLTGFSRATYSTLFVNPGRIQVAPAFEIGAASETVQHLVKDLSAGRLDCTKLDGLGFTHLIEERLAGRTAACLELEATQGGWRLWRIR